jgi:hypothetical protein
MQDVEKSLHFTHPERAISPACPELAKTSSLARGTRSYPNFVLASLNGSTYTWEESRSRPARGGRVR